MRVQPLVRVLRSSAAIGALVIGSAEAHAACTTTNGVVTCTDANPSDQVNASVNSAPPPSVSLVIAEGATVARSGFAQSISPSSFQFPAAIGYTNRGVVGTPNANVDFAYFGPSGFSTVAGPSNTFTFTNSGIQNGAISAVGVGGAISGTNSGTVTRGIDLRGAGPITFTNTGAVSNTGTFGGGTAITLTSSLTRFGTGTDGVTRASEIGAPVIATIEGVVGVSATPTAQFQAQGVAVASVGGVNVAVNGRVGVVQASSFGTNSENLFASSVNSRTQSTDSRSIGAETRVTVGAAGRATSVSASSSSAATAAVNGILDGNGFGSPALSVSALGRESSFRSTERSTFNPFTQDSSFAASERSTGGAALAEVGMGGRVNGGGSATSNAGAATVRVIGQVEGPSGQLSATSTGVNSSRQGQSVVRPDGSSDGSSSSTAALSGGAALVAVASTGVVNIGFVSATGDASAAVDNAGRIRGSVSANSNNTIETARTSTNSRTIATDPGGSTRTETTRFNSSATSESLAGTATITNRLGAVVQGSVQANGARGVTLDNAGTITGGVSLGSAATRSLTTSAETSTTTTVPATGGGTTVTFVRDASSTTSSQATGGAARGFYAGTVGSVQPEGSFNFGGVTQSGNTGSTASVSGTLLGSFSGTAFAENRDSANGSSARQTTQRDGSATRVESSNSRQTTAQRATNSSLTVAATGAVLDNGSGSSFVNVSSGGGNAALTLDGGRIDGDVSVAGGSATNTVQLSDFGSTFTRPATTGGFFVPEVQQSQTRSSSSERRAAAGAATVSVNSGSIGGDISVDGTGTGAGSLAASVLVNGTVSGGVSAFGPSLDSRNPSSETSTRTGPNTVTRTTMFGFTQSTSALAGNVLIDVNGTVGGGIAAGGVAGSATVNLAGPAGGTTADGVAVTAFAIASQRDSVQTGTGTSFFFNERTTGFRASEGNTVVGGTATLNVAAGAALRAADGSSIEGDIVVQGLAASTLNVAAGSRVVQTDGDISVGGNLNPTSFDLTGVFTGGVQTGSTGTSAGRFVAGPATITNAGIIGSTANRAIVSAASVGGATVRNTGTIDGAIVADARGASRASTMTSTDLNNFALRRTVSTNVITAAGGAALVDNSALVTGAVTAIAANGIVANSGVIRGGVTLGGGFVNFTTTVISSANPTTGAPVTTTTAAPASTLFTQNYRLDQNGLLQGGVNVTGTSTVDPSGGTTRTSVVNAAVNLNNGSITLGNITAVPESNTSVALNGAGFLGVATNDLPRALVPGQIVTGFVPTPSLTRFIAIDPALATSSLPPGSRVSGVQSLTKTGDGTFVIVGAPLLVGVGTAAPTYTLDVGTLRVAGGELQLGLAGTTPTANSFGIRGNVENNANLVVGRRITDGARTAIQGINASVLGNFTNASAGSLIVGVDPALVRGSAAQPGANPFGTALSPFVVAGGAQSIGSANSFVRVDGNLALAGTIAVQAPAGGIYEAGRAYDLFSVSGTYANTATLRTGFASPFIGFALTQRTEGGRTIVSLNIARNDFATVTTDRNAAAAAGALQATLPSVFSGIRSGSASADVQDFATIVAALDTQLNSDQAAQLFRELSSGEIYGSLSAVSTTVPFGEATDGLPPISASAGVGLWFRPTGQFATYRADRQAGASAIDVNNYGGSIGFNYATGQGGHVGIAGGYGELRVRSATPERADADTYMLGVYGVQQAGRLHLSAQAVYGWSKWDVARTLPLLGRRATGAFDSNELRGSIRAAYSVGIAPNFDLSPFARVEARRYSFDAFTEQGAGVASLSVAKRSRTVISPEVGMRMAAASDRTFRPFAEASYLFQGDVGSDRRVALASGAGQSFVVDGVDPRRSIKGAIGVAADAAGGTVFLRGDYLSGGRQQVGSVRGGMLFNF